MDDNWVAFIVGVVVVAFLIHRVLDTKRRF